MKISLTTRNLLQILSSIVQHQMNAGQLFEVIVQAHDILVAMILQECQLLGDETSQRLVLDFQGELLVVSFASALWEFI